MTPLRIERKEPNIADPYILCTATPGKDGGVMLNLSIRHRDEEHALSNAEFFIKALADLMAECMLDDMLGEIAESN